MFALYIISVINGLVVGGCHFQAFWVGSKPVRSNFFIFLEPGKKSEIFFSRKNRRFFSDFFTHDFSIPKSFPAPPKSDFSPKNRPKLAIFLSLGTHMSLFLSFFICFSPETIYFVPVSIFFILNEYSLYTCHFSRFF